jgi:hypothetical protein
MFGLASVVKATLEKAGYSFVKVDDNARPWQMREGDMIVTEGRALGDILREQGKALGVW